MELETVSAEVDGGIGAVVELDGLVEARAFDVFADDQVIGCRCGCSGRCDPRGGGDGEGRETRKELSFHGVPSEDFVCLETAHVHQRTMGVG